MLIGTNKKILFLIIGCLRPGFIEDIRSWEPIINIFKNIEILYVLKDRINLIPEVKIKHRPSASEGKSIIPWENHWWRRMFGYNPNELNVIGDFISNTSINFEVSYADCYSRPVDCSYLYETLPFFTTKKSSLLLLNNDEKIDNNPMFYSWNIAYKYINNNNIDFDYCVKIRPDNITNTTPEMFGDILNYCAYTEHLITGCLWKEEGKNIPNCVDDQLAIGTKKNMMIYLNTPGPGWNCHPHLLEYLVSKNITIANGGGFTKVSLRPWELQRNRYFKDFLYKNIDREHYREFLALLNQLSTSS